MIASVIIPTYGRGEKLGATLDALLKSDTSGLNDVEVIVVDDGSPEPVGPFVQSLVTRPPISLRCIRQENAGPAVARNRGFRESHGDIVLFLDDDILVPRGLIRLHVEAHRCHPGSVVFGRCVPPKSLPDTPYLRYVLTRGHDPGANAT